MLCRPKETNDAGERSYRGNCVASCCRCQFRGLNAQMRPKSREELVRQALDIVLNHLPQLLDAQYPLLAGQDALQARALVLKSQLEAQELVYEAQRVEAVKQSRAAHELAMAVEEAQQAQELKESRAAHKQAMADLRAEQQQARAAHVQAKMCIEATYAREIGHLNAARANTLSEHLYALSRTAASCQVAGTYQTHTPAHTHTCRCTNTHTCRCRHADVPMCKVQRLHVIRPCSDSSLRCLVSHSHRVNVCCDAQLREPRQQQSAAARHQRGPTACLFVWTVTRILIHRH